MIFLLFLSLCIGNSQGVVSAEQGTDNNFANKKILLIPLDSRPVNTSYVSLLGEAAGAQVLTPPSSALDQYLLPANYTGLKDFMVNNIAAADAIIIGIPEWLNGGLIEARDVRSYINNKNRLQELKDILAKYPEKKVYLFGLIPREYPSSKLPSSQYQAEISVYGELYEQFFTTQNLKEKHKLWTSLKEMENSLPPSYISDYVRLFEENFNIHKELIGWVQSGIADELLIGMDDTSKKGITKLTERKLKDYIAQNNCKNVTLMSGADELTSLILARYKNEITQSGSQYTVTYSQPKDSGIVLPFDGKNLGQVIQEKIDYVQPQIRNDAIPLQVYVHSSEEPIDPLIDWTNANDGQIKGVANIVFSYTSPVWMENYFQQKLDQKIESYSGWNTGANTVGLLISHMEMIKNISTWNDSNEKWMLLRYVEDYYYNQIQRTALNNKYNSNYELTPLETSAMSPILLNGSNEFLNSLSVVTSKDGFRSSIFAQYAISNVEFPWNRIFEIAFEFTKKLTTS